MNAININHLIISITVIIVNRQRRLSRDRPAMPQVLSISNSQAGAGSEYFSDSNDSLYSGTGDTNNSQQQGFKQWLQQQQHQATVHNNTGSANSNSTDSEFHKVYEEK